MIRIPRRATAIVAAAAVVAGLAACAPQTAEPTVTTLKTSVLSYMVASNWNPVTSPYLNTYFPAQQGIYETLIRLNTEIFEYEPLLAESYEIGDDQRTITLTLRDDVDFTDGTHFDAAAAKAALENVIAGPSGNYFSTVNPVELEATGEYELTITSQTPMDGTFLFWLAISPMVSPTAVEEDPDGLETTPVGTGPYILEEQVPDVSTTFVRNPDYRAPEDYPFDEIDFLVFDDSVAASNALKSGQINVAQLDPSLAADAEAAGLTINTGGGTNYELIWIDPAGAVVPELADVRVRQAIALAIDRESIKDSINFGYGTVSSQVWGEGSPYYVNGGDERYAYDLDAAKALMEEAGYADGFAITMPSTAIFAKYEPVLAQALADIGITVTFEQYADLVAMIDVDKSGKYGLMLNTIPDLDLVGTAQRNQYPQLADPLEVLNTGTPEEIADAQQEIGQIVLDDALLIAFTRTTDTWASVPEISVGVGVITGWPPILQAFRLAD